MEGERCRSFRFVCLCMECLFFFLFFFLCVCVWGGGGLGCCELWLIVAWVVCDMFL